MSRLMFRLLGVCLIAGAWTIVPGVVSAPASAVGSCSETVSLEGADTECVWSWKEYQSSSGDGSVWTVAGKCDNGGICASYIECEEDGERGIFSDVLRDGVDVGDVCIPDKDRDKVDPGAAAVTFFEDFDWPASTLMIQPQEGQTLVNFETIFYTTNTESTFERVTLLGQRIVVKADPVAYLWDFGDGTTAETEDAGLPYPDQTVVHEYTDLDPVKPSVGTVYRGEYQVNDGPWRPIEVTLTVDGPTEDLEILEAIPELVEGPDE